MAVDGNTRYVYIPETGDIRKATIGSEADRELEADLQARVAAESEEEQNKFEELIRMARFNDSIS